MCNSFSSPTSHSLREKNNYADFGKSSQAIRLEEVPNPALENLFKQQRYSRCVGNGWFDGDTCYPQIPFLLAFHWKRRCTCEQMDCCFFPSSILFPAATRQGMQGLHPSPWLAKCQEGHSDHLPRISGKSQKHRWVSMSL